MDVRRGRVISVSREHAGSSTVADAFIGDDLTVEDASDFQEDGGNARLYDGSHIEYSAADMETDTLTVVGGLPVDVPAGTFVYLHAGRTAVTAEVELDGEADSLTVLVPHHLRPLLSLGARDATEAQEDCTVVYDGRGWILFDVQGTARPRLSSEHAPKERVYRYTAEDVPGDGYRGVKFFPAHPGRLFAVKVIADAAALDDSDFTILLNGGDIADGAVTVKQDKRSRYHALADPVSFDDGDRLRVRFDDPDFPGGTTIRVYLYVELEVD